MPRMKSTIILPALTVLCGTFFGQSAVADVTIRYNEYSGSPTIGRGDGTSTDPTQSGLRCHADIHPEGHRVHRCIARRTEGRLPARPENRARGECAPGRRAICQRKCPTEAGRFRSELGLHLQFGALWNEFPADAWISLRCEAGRIGRNGVELAQAMLDSRGGTQIVFPVIGSTMQGSGYFPRPIGKPDCNAGDADCENQGNGIGLAGLCTSGWRIRYLSPPEDIVNRACDLLVQRGVIPAKTLTFYPAVGGQSVLLPMQRSTIQGFEYVNPIDDLVDFFPVKNATPARPLGDPDAGDSGLQSRPLRSRFRPAPKPNCSQNIGQLGARYAHHPSWHQPFLLSWMHIDKAVWNGLNAAQRAAILRAARESVVESYNATESIACRKMKDMLDFNDGINQRNLGRHPAVDRRKTRQCENHACGLAGRRIESTSRSQKRLFIVARRSEKSG